jgi:hypothetical protein
VPDQERRATNDYTASQSGDHTARDAAGRDIYHSGADPERVFDLVRFLFEDRQERDVRRDVLDNSLQDIRDTIELYRITTTARIEAVAKWQRRLTWGIVALALLWIAGLCVLALLIYDRYLAVAVFRAWLGAGLALALWRH